MIEKLIYEVRNILTKHGQPHFTMHLDWEDWDNDYGFSTDLTLKIKELISDECWVELCDLLSEEAGNNYAVLYGEDDLEYVYDDVIRF